MNIESNISVILNALNCKLDNSSKKNGNKSNLWKTVFKKALKGKLSRSSFMKLFEDVELKNTEKRNALVAVISSYTDTHGINIDKLVAEYQKLHPQFSTNGLHIFSGAWFAITFRAKRKSPGAPTTPLDYRVGILIYGKEKSGKVPFQVIGENSQWNGTLQQQNRQYLFTGTKINLPDKDESVTMLLHSIFPQETVCYHHGIMLGTASGAHNANDSPIYASRLILWKILDDRPYSNKAPSEEDIALLRSQCGYLTKSQFKSIKAKENSNKVVSQKIQAIDAFISLGDGSLNTGNVDRMLLVT